MVPRKYAGQFALKIFQTLPKKSDSPVDGCSLIAWFIISARSSVEISAKTSLTCVNNSSRPFLTPIPICTSSAETSNEGSGTT